MRPNEQRTSDKTPPSRRLRLCRVAAVALGLACAPAFALEPDENEEAAGASFQMAFNPQDNVYGIAFGSGVWIKGTPMFGDYFVTLFENRIEDAFYSGLGLTVRVMPHWRWAPFVGGGGSYNYAIHGSNETNQTVSLQQPADTDSDSSDKRGQSYWAGHAEAGLRIWLDSPVRLIEISGRYTWPNLRGDRAYWLAAISVGSGF